MSIRLICVCGRGMALPEKYAGEHVQCPDCRAMLRIPRPDENLSLTHWVCSCGQRLKARARTGGRKLRCPKCSAEVTVPFSDKPPADLVNDFALDEESGIVQRRPKLPRGDPRPAGKSAPPGAEPPVRNLLSIPPLERIAPPAPAAPKPPLPPGPAVLLESDADATRIRSRGPNPLGEPARARSQGATGVYELTTPPPAEPAPARQPPPRPAETAAETLPPVMAAPDDEEESCAEEVEEEGIRAPELITYFNAKTGSEAARAAVMQVLNGYWLCIPCALLAACMADIAQLALGATRGNAAAAIGWLALPALFCVFLWAGFVACVKDAIFERDMGIERLFCNAGVHFLRFTATSLMVLPIGAGIAMAGALAIGAVWGPAPFIIRVGIVALAGAAGLFALELLLMPPVIAVLEHRDAFSSLTRGMLFSFRHVWDLITITAASTVILWGTMGVTYLFWWLSRLLLEQALPAWLFESLKQFFGGLILAAFMGQIVASLMLLYLSHIGDEKRLREIQSKLRGPAAVPMRLYATIGAAAVALLAINCLRPGWQPAAKAPFDAAPAVLVNSPEPLAPQAHP